MAEREPEPRTEPPPRLDDEGDLGPVLIGWKEWVGLPLLGIPAIRAKADTGARTGALDADSIARFTLHGRPMLSFRVLPFRGDRLTAVHAACELVDERLVRSSHGDVQMRPVIRTVLTIAGLERSIELTLTRRDQMDFRLLLGRAALAGMLVDPVRSYLWGEFTPELPFRPSSLPPRRDAHGAAQLGKGQREAEEPHAEEAAHLLEGPMQTHALRPPRMPTPCETGEDDSG